MKTGRFGKEPRRAVAHAAFTLVELMVAMAIIGAVVVALYSAISSGFGSIRLARENLRATHILLEKTEGIRLYDWDQLTNSSYVQPTFSVPYDPTASNGQGGITYFGTVSVSPVSLNSSYSNDLRLVTIQVSWTNGLPRQRQLSTYVCRTGLQNYLY